MGRTANRKFPIRRATTCLLLCLYLPVALALAAPAPPSLLRPPAPEIQRQTLLASVARMEHGTAAGGDVYFVGFAGFGEQKVFREEAQLAQQVFAARFATGNRSLLLVNDIHD